LTPNGSASGAPGQGCDPDVANCGTNSGTSAQSTSQQVNAIPVATSASLGDGLQVTLMTLGAALLLGLIVLPPVIAQAGRRRRQRNGGLPGGFGDFL